MSGIVNRATETAVNTATAAAAIVDPYTPQVVKNVASYALATAVNTKDYALATATSTKDRAVGTVTGTVNFGVNTVNATTAFATGKVYDALDFGKVVVNGATTTITAYTPNPILNLINGTIAQAKNLHEDPINTVKNYPFVPAFVIHSGEKTYEIVHNAKDATTNGVNATTGLIVTKVNGVVHAVTSVPQIHSLIEQINRLTAPVLAKFGVTKGVSVEPELVVVGTPGVAAKN
ncbi:hypothetical protein HKX48_001681 [Thoreauomyces humboldtii]|nr:hypothetical protein HKX48_001681 [Thoreauomyces humboldtii]